MANVRDSDTSLWLHNKLGTSNDSWINGSICSQLNKEVLRNIKDCFPDLQTQVKLKLLLSFLHIPRRLVEEVKKISLVSCIKKSTLACTRILKTHARIHTHTQAGKRPYMLRWWIHSICMLLGTPKCPENVSNMREITNWGVLKFTYIYYPYQHIHTSEQVLLFCSHIDIRNISRHFCASDLCVHVCVCVRQWVVLVLVLLLVLMLVLVFIRVYKRGACGR